MLPCREVARLCASDEIRSAPIATRLRVRMHLMLCRHCRRYVRELAAIGRAAREMLRTAIEDPERYQALIRRVLSDTSDSS